MDCPQCEGEDTLATYTDGEREAFVCEDCGYVGIPADHRGEPGERETWADAVTRFHEEHPFLRDGESPGAETPVRRAIGRSRRRGDGPETWGEALRAFDETRENGNGDAGSSDEDGQADGETGRDDTPGGVDGENGNGAVPGSDPGSGADPEPGSDRG
jgi:Zn ribbon nucleic-acid-binding protein